MTNPRKRLADYIHEGRATDEEAAPPQDVSKKLSPQEILKLLKARNERNAGPNPQTKVDGRLKQHPKKGILTSLKRFIALREEKLEKQAHEGDPLGLASNARQLAARLADPEQVAAHISELNAKADAYEDEYQSRLEKCKAFWYGPDGLAWLGEKKGMQSHDWLAYADSMDQAALKALAALIERELLRRYMQSVQ